MNAHEFSGHNIVADDHRLMSIMQWLYAQENTVVALFSDHGPHSSIGMVFNSPTAVLEHRLPLVSLMMPKKGLFLF